MEGIDMKKKIFKILFVIIIILAIVYICISRYKSRTKYNDGYVNGNTAGNLYNAGLFCENDGKVFFANPDDNNYLYSMDSSGGNLKKLCEDNVMYINADSNYVYYVRNNNMKNSKSDSEYSYFSFNNNSLCRIDRDGKNITILDEAPCIYATLIGNYIYYLHYDDENATSLYVVGIDGKDPHMVQQDYAFTCNSVGQYFYFNSPTTGALMRFNTASNTASTIYNCHCYKPTVIDNKEAYYLDVDQKNALVHTNLENINPTTLTTDSIELYNVYGSNIYYQRTGEQPALCIIKNDGSESRTLAIGEYTAINVTSYNIYFKDFMTGTMYCTPTVNPGQITEFHPGVDE